MKQAALDIPRLVWHGCYEGSWRGLIVPDAFNHPAKFARGLVTRIVRHGLERSWWKPDDTIGDPFGGVALGGIACGYEGLNWVGVELEQRFVDLGNANLQRHGPKWMALDLASRVTLLQGDSRRFSERIGCDAIVTSPPYADSVNKNGHGFDWTKGKQVVARPRSAKRHFDLLASKTNYGRSDGQIGSLGAGPVDAVITSPPYGRGGQGGGSDFHPDPERHGDNSNGGSLRRGYGDQTGQIGNCHEGSVDAVVTSPRYAEGLGHGGGRPLHQPGAPGTVTLQGQKDGYGDSDAQIGNAVGETYWQAMHQVYGQCGVALRPGGVMCVVVKDYVKDRKRQPLCDDTLRLLMHLGFEPVERIRAMLVKETREACLFTPGGHQVRRTERKSFFRRLAEKKGSPRIDWEEVLVVRKGVCR